MTIRFVVIAAMAGGKASLSGCMLAARLLPALLRLVREGSQIPGSAQRKHTWDFSGEY
jgi:hypothetical protein